MTLAFFTSIDPYLSTAMKDDLLDMHTGEEKERKNVERVLTPAHKLEFEALMLNLINIPYEESSFIFKNWKHTTAWSLGLQKRIRNNLEHLLTE